MFNQRRFWPLVEVSHPLGCWEWAGAIFSNGYGRFGEKRAHRLSYEFFLGRIGEGLVIDHLCRNKLCVNPDHLEAVTEKENIRRGEGLAAKNARARKCAKGHTLTRGNYYIIRGTRQCRFCSDARTRAWRYRKKREEEQMVELETKVRNISRLGLNWQVASDPIESRWFLGPVAVLRTDSGWEVVRDGHRLAHHRRHRDALHSAVDAYMLSEEPT